MVALYWLLNFLFTYWFISDVLPTLHIRQHRRNENWDCSSGRMLPRRCLLAPKSSILPSGDMATRDRSVIQ